MKAGVTKREQLIIAYDTAGDIKRDIKNIERRLQNAEDEWAAQFEHEMREYWNGQIEDIEAELADAYQALKDVEQVIFALNPYASDRPQNGS